MKATQLLPSFSYLIIGSGRVARHLSHYFNLKNISFQAWDRAQDPHALRGKILDCTHVLLAISDQAIPGFYRQHLAGMDKTVVHFSGAHHFDEIIAAHPLMTFGSDLYDLEFYSKIHFSLTGGQMAETLPGLENPNSSLVAEKKPLYHASCVLGGNFTTLLISKMLSTFDELQIPHSSAQLYIEKIVENVFNNPGSALTGPLARKDEITVRSNLDALKNDPHSPQAIEIYEAFVKTYWPEFFQNKK